MSRVRRLSKRDYYRIYSLVPRLTIDLITFYDGGLVLSKRDIPPCKGMWHLPGGTILLGEGLVDAAKRISREETGISIDVLGLLGVKEYSRRVAFGQVISLVFLTRGIRGKLRGNEYAREVRVFKSLPYGMIKEQKDMLLELGITDPDGKLKMDRELLLEDLLSKVLKVSSLKLWNIGKGDS